MEEENLKQNILAVISGLLCDEGELRNVAEERRKALEFKPEYPVQLADILHDAEEPIEERLMCAIMLKEYVSQFWEFKTNFCTGEVKATTRTLLSHALGDENVKIMDSAAYLLGIIAQADYPHTWKEMLSMLTDKLRSQDQRVVIGGVTFMQECFQKIPELLQENLINESMYDFFYGITEQENIYNTKLRSKVVELVTNLIIQDFSKDKDIARVGPTANRFTAIMGYILNQQYGPSSDFQIKAAIVAAFTKFLCTVPEMVGQLVISTLPIIWDILIACASEYRQIIAVRSNSNAFLQNRVLPLDATEESGYPTHFMSLVDNIFTMIQYVSATEEPFASIDVDLYMGEKNLTDIIHSILIFSCASPYTERDIYNNEFEYIDEDLLDDDVPTSYVSTSSNNSSRLGLRYLLRSVIRSSSSVMQSLACLRMAIVRALEYMQLRRVNPPLAEVAKLKFLEEECDVNASAAAQRASQTAGIGVVVQRLHVPQPIFTPPPGGYDLYVSRVVEGVMYVLCSVATLVGNPDQILSPMVQPAICRQQPHQQPQQQRQQQQQRPQPGPSAENRAGPSGLIGLSGNLDNLMLGYARRMKPEKAQRLTNIEFNVREFLNKFLGITQSDDVLLNCRLMSAAAYYCWVFSVSDFKNQLQKVLEHLHGDYDICRHAAVRALKTHCDYLKGFTQPAGFANMEVRFELREEFKCFVIRFNNSLIALAPFANIDMLNVIVSNLTYFLGLNTHAPEQMAEFVMTSLMNHMTNYEFIANIKLLIDVLTTVVQNKSYFQRQLFHRLVDMVRNATSSAIIDQNERLMDKSVGLHIFSDVLRTVDDPEVQRELLNMSLRTVYMAVMSGPADVDVARNGQRCLSVFFLRFGDQLLQMGPVFDVQAYVSIFTYAMDLYQPEEVCAGLEHPFLAMLIYLHEEFATFLDAFVKSLLSRLNHSQSLDARDSLLMMFLGLFYYYGSPTMRLLAMLPGPDGATSALMFIIPLLLDVHYNSCYTQNLYVHVISQIMQKTFLMNDRRFVELLVQHRYQQEEGVVHVVHNRHVLQPCHPIPQKQTGSDTPSPNTHASTSSSTIDSDNAIPPIYRSDALALALRQRQPRPLHPILQARLGRASTSAPATAASGTVGVAESSTNSGTNMAVAGPSTSHAGQPHHRHVSPASSDNSVVRDSAQMPAAEVESMDLSCSSSAAHFPVPSTVPPLDLRSLASALTQDESEEESGHSPEEVFVSTVPFLHKAFRMLLDVMLANRRIHPERGEVILTELFLFPAADSAMDIRTYHPLTVLAALEIVPFLQTFFNGLVNGNYLELFNLCQGLNETHRQEVQRVMQVRTNH